MSKKMIFYPTVTVTDNGDGTAEVEFDWEESIGDDHIEDDNVDEFRLSNAMDEWKGRPETFTIVIPKDKRIVEKPIPKVT